MIWLALYRNFKTGLTNFWRNIWLSTAATLIMVITLMILTVTLLVLNLSNTTIKKVQERVDISVYFKSQTSESQILTIKSQLETLPQTASVTYISSQQALDIFKQRNANDPNIVASLGEFDQNPLPATLEVKAKSLDQYPILADALNNQQYAPYISKINFDDNRALIDRLSRVLNTVRNVGIGLLILFSFIAVLVIFNTIRLTIYNRREEVEIMRLVGATNWYIRWPFIIESTIYAFAATIVTLLLMIPVWHYIIPRIAGFFALSRAEVVGFGFFEIFLLQLAAALFLGIISSLIAIRRYLRV
jgi:cell division transport system permease protein